MTGQQKPPRSSDQASGPGARALRVHTQTEQDPDRDSDRAPRSGSGDRVCLDKVAWIGGMTTVDGAPCSFRYGREFTVLSKRRGPTGTGLVRLLSDNGAEFEIAACNVDVWFSPSP